jgi:hypothetical protein
MTASTFTTLNFQNGLVGSSICTKSVIHFLGKISKYVLAEYGAM